MIVLDTNVVLYAADDESPHYGKVREWMSRMLDAGETFGIPWLVIVAFVRIATLPGILSKPLSVDQALEFVERMLGQPESYVLVDSSVQQFIGFTRFLRAAGIAGNLTNDAHIAAVALSHGGRVASFDRDFTRFEGIQLIVPE